MRVTGTETDYPFNHKASDRLLVRQKSNRRSSAAKEADREKAKRQAIEQTQGILSKLTDNVLQTKSQLELFCTEDAYISENGTPRGAWFKDLEGNEVCQKALLSILQSRRDLRQLEAQLQRISKKCKNLYRKVAFVHFQECETFQRD